MSASPQPLHDPRNDRPDVDEALRAKLMAMPWPDRLAYASERGMVMRELAALLSVTRGCVSNQATRYGIRFHGKGGPRKNIARIDRLRAYAAAGLLQAEAAEAEGINPGIVSQIAAREGIRFRRYHEEIGAFLAASRLPEGER